MHIFYHVFFNTWTFNMSYNSFINIALFLKSENITWNFYENRYRYIDHYSVFSHFHQYHNPFWGNCDPFYRIIVLTFPFSVSWWIFCYELESEYRIFFKSLGGKVLRDAYKNIWVHCVELSFYGIYRVLLWYLSFKQIILSFSNYQSISAILLIIISQFL